MRLFRTKSLAQFQAEAKQTHLAKTLTAFDLVMLGLGAIIGVGVFVLTGVAASLYSGPAITLSFALGGLTCIFTAFTYTELASAIPVAGGAYAYMYVVLGEIIAWMVGWTDDHHFWWCYGGCWLVWLYSRCVGYRWRPLTKIDWCDSGEWRRG